MVYNTVRDITIDKQLVERMTARNELAEEYIDTNRMAIIMNKCPNIQTINCLGDNNHKRQLFEAIQQFRDHWPHLKSLYL